MVDLQFWVSFWCIAKTGVYTYVCIYIYIFHVMVFLVYIHIYVHICICTYVYMCGLSGSVMSDSLQRQGLQHTRLLCPWDSLGKNTGLGCHALLQGIFPTQGSNPGLPHCRQILHWLNHKGSSRILEWIAYPFFRGSPQPRDRTQVSHIAGRFFIDWTTREAQEYWSE